MKKRILGVLGKRLLLYFVTLSLIPALVLSYINYVHSKKLLETEMFNELSLVGQALAEHINEFLRNGENSAKHFSSDGFIRGHLEKIATMTENTNISQELSKYLDYKTKLEPRFRETFTTNPRGIVLASSNIKRVGVDMSDDFRTLETKDKYTEGHSRRVAEYATDICKKMSFSKEYLEDIQLGSLLHDIGKIGIKEIRKFSGTQFDPEIVEMLTTNGTAL